MEYTIKDLVSAVASDNPTDFRSAFDGVIVDRIGDAIAAKKIEVAKSLTGTAVQETQPIDTDEGTPNGDHTEEAA